MTIVIEIKRTILLVAERKGVYRTLVFADMPASRARQLAAEYGYTEEDIIGIYHEALHYRRRLDNELVRIVLDRLPYLENHTPEQMIAAVRSIVPQAIRIIEN